jgi:hypothetical protein
MITKHYKIIIACIITFMAVVSFSLAWNDSLTFDEIAHIGSGYSYVTQHDYRLNPEHPPLLKIIAGIAMLPLQPTFDTTQDFWTKLNNFGEYDQWAAGRYLLHQANNNTDWLVFWARTPIVIISLLFGLFLFFWGRKLGGIITGLFALILYAFDPNVLGHNHFVTTDIGIAIAIAIAFYFFLQFLKKPTWLNVFLGGLALGIAQVTKFSAILLIPLFTLLLISYPLIKFYNNDSNKLKTFGLYIFKGICAMIIAGVVVWLVYVPVTYKMDADVLPPITASKSQPHKYVRDNYLSNFILQTNQNSLTRPIAVYIQGLMQVFGRVDDGNVTYFMHKVSSDASHWYFPFVFIAKQTLIHLFFYTVTITIFLVLLVQSIIALFNQKLSTSLHKLHKFTLNHFNEISFGLFIIMYSYLSISGNLNIGFRHLFPIMPFVYLLTSKTIIDSYKNLRNPKRKKVIRGIFIALILTLAATTVLAYPYYMSYFNILFGGPKNGYHYVTDSNADWGQDLKRLKIWLNDHPEVQKINIDYFGGDDINNRLGFGNYELWWDSKRPIEPGFYAISTLLLQESLYDTNKPYDDSYRWTQDLTPYAQVGTSIIVYKVD